VKKETLKDWIARQPEVESQPDVISFNGQIIIEFPKWAVPRRRVKIRICHQQAIDSSGDCVCVCVFVVFVCVWARCGNPPWCQ
jgi:hypothetical protein